MFEPLVELLKAPRKLIHTEVTDKHILKAVTRFKRTASSYLLFIGNVKVAVAEGCFYIDSLEILDPATYPSMDKFVNDFFEFRKATAQDARKMLLMRNTSSPCWS